MRLAGNHELMWAEGVFRYAHENDRATREKAVAAWRADVLAGVVVGARAFPPFLVTHAGFRSALLNNYRPTRAADLAAAVSAALVDTLSGIRDSDDVLACDVTATATVTPTSSPTAGPLETTGAPTPAAVEAEQASTISGSVAFGESEASSASSAASRSPDTRSE